MAGAATLAVAGLSVIQFQELFQHRPQQPKWVLELARDVEAVTDSSLSKDEKEQIFQEIREVAHSHQLPVTELLADGVYSEMRLIERYLLLVQELGIGAENQDLDVTYKLQSLLPQTRTQLDELQRTLLQYHRYWYTTNLEQQELTLALADWFQKQEQLISEMPETMYGPLPEDAAALTITLDFYALRQSSVRPASSDSSATGILFLTVATELERQGLTLHTGSELTQRLSRELVRGRLFLQAVAVLALLLGMLAGVLMTFGRLQWPQTVPRSAHFIAFLPEECVAELGVLNSHLEEQNISSSQRRIQILRQSLSIFWAFYVEVQLQNLFLPWNDHSIDD